MFTIAPLFSLLTNLLEIKIKLDSAGKYSRRFKADGGSGIGIWLQIMDFLSFLAIPINIAILFFCGHGGESSEGAMWKFMESRNIDPSYEWDGSSWTFVSFEWDKYTIFLLAIGVEHLLFIIKAGLAVTIKDVPSEVLVAEKKRPFEILKAL